MPAYKDSKTGTWFVKFYCSKDWTGENKQIKKRGFATKREALDYERNYKIRQENNLDITFGELWRLYTEDVKNYVKLNTWLTKEHIVDTKILPYFKNLKMNEITPGDVRKWQNEMVAFRNENGKSYSQTYKKTMHNILSAIFNHACRFYNLKSNPARQAGNMGREEKKEMLFWTTEEYKKFSEAVIDKPVSFYAFEMLYWTGMRLGELLALTMEDFDFEKNTVRINKSYQRLQGQDVITTPKTPKNTDQDDGRGNRYYGCSDAVSLVWGQKAPPHKSEPKKCGGKKCRQNSKVTAKSATTQISEKKAMVAESAIKMEKWWRKTPLKQ